MDKTIIFLIRHSEQLRDDSGRIKNEDIILSENGKNLAEKLSELEELKNIDVIFSSNYARAYQTAEYIALKLGLKILVDERIGERKLRRFRKIEKTWREIKKRFYYRAIVKSGAEKFWWREQLGSQK